MIEKYTCIADLTFTTLWANSADDKLLIFFLFFPENKIWHFMHIASSETCLLEKHKKNISICLQLKNFTQSIKH